MNVRLNEVSFAYDTTPVLDRVSLTLPNNGVVCLWGPSGCGKTTLLRLLAGLEKPDAGVIEGGGRVSMVFQEDRLLPWLSTLENVTITGADGASAEAMLQKLGLTQEEMGALPRQLSGGQQRRVALARALAAESDLLLLDEPFNGLDEDTWQNVVPLIADYAVSRPVVLVTHIRQQAGALKAQMVPLIGTPLTGELKPENL